MADNPDNRPSALAAALAGKLGGVTDRQQYVPSPLYPEEDVQAFSERLRAQFYSEKAAKEVIYGAVSEWSGVPALPGGQIPIVRNGQIVEWSSSILSDPAQAILRAARLLPVASLNAEREQLSALLKAMLSVRRGMEDLELEYSTTVNNTWRSWERGRGEPVDIVHALGINLALNVSLHGAMHNIRQRLNEIEAELRLRSSKKGRPPARPAHEAAREFAFLYARVTGKRPTCSVSNGTASGEFGRALFELFGAFGWADIRGRADPIRGPGAAAVKAITDDFLRKCEPLRKGHFGGIFGGSR